MAKKSPQPWLAKPRKQVAVQFVKTHCAAGSELWHLLDTPFANRPKTVLLTSSPP
jgi:hypothetical protein